MSKNNVSSISKIEHNNTFLEIFSHYNNIILYYYCCYGYTADVSRTCGRIPVQACA